MFAKLLDAIFFSRVSPLVRQSRKKVLTLKDVPNVPDWLAPENVAPVFLKLDLQNPWRFLRQIFWGTRPYFWYAASLVLALWVFGVGGPFVIHAVIKTLQAVIENQGSVVTAFGLTAAFVGISVTRSLCVQHYIYWVVSLEQFVINGLNFRIYQHALKLSRQAVQKRPVGDIVNHMGTDTFYVSEFPFVTFEVVYGIGIMALVTAATYHFLGVSAFAGLAVLALLGPLCRKAAQRFVRFEDEIMKIRDERVNLMSQFISSIRIIKYLVWETAAANEIAGKREGELSGRKRLAWAKALSLLLFLAARTLAVAAAFGSYVLLGHELDAATIFACIALFDLWDHPFAHLAHQMADIAEARVGAQRISAFLKEETLSVATSGVSLKATAAPSLKITDLAVAIEKKPILSSVNLHIHAGEAVAICGQVGAGKTSLLLALLGEYQSAGEILWHKGETLVAPDLGYVPQRAYVMNNSLRENILFGNTAEIPLDQAVEAAGLRHDVDTLPGGLDTEIGEQGVNLSGGQKQRVALCRAIVQDADVLLLDDPLSAVDVNTERHLVDKLIFGLWRDKTRLVVTHRLEHLGRFDRVVFMEDGMIVAEGTFAELCQKCPSFVAFYDHHRQTHRESHLVKTDATIAKKEVERVTDDEDRSEGEVRLTVYLDYLRALAGNKSWRTAVLFLSTAACVTLPFLQNLWLTWWSGKKFALTEIENLGIYFALAITAVLLGFGRFTYWHLRSVAAGRSLHDQALKSTLNTFTRFFDANPAGRILNRFAYDLDAIETEIPWSVEQMVYSAINAMLLAVVMVVLVPWAAVVAIPGGFAFYWLQSHFRTIGREIKRLNAITRSPRFAHFKETIDGLEVVRANRAADWFWQKYYNVLRENQKTFHLMVLVNRWFSCRLPVLSGAMNLFAVTVAVYLVDQRLMEPGTVGLLLVTSFMFSDSLNWSVRSFSEAEARLTSVERLKYYASLPHEPRILAKEPTLMPAHWPSRGQLTFENVHLRYAPHLPVVLHGVNFAIQGGAKVGIVGRTGSGKSSIIQALFRLVPIEKGRILIDGVDIAGVDRDVLRRAIAIIPQDPVLYLGTLRENLDRFNAFDDATIWSVLRRLRFAERVENLAGGLNARVAEGGSNFSLGERQILCLARALLLRAKIVVLDEATASVDVETDRRLHQVLQEVLDDCTVIIIAHRLGTVAHCDALIEMAQGKVVRKDEAVKSRQGAVATVH